MVTVQDENDLAAELMTAQAALNFADETALLSLGIPPRMVLRGLIGAATVRIEGAAYVPDEDGVRCFIAACQVDPDNPITPESAAPELIAQYGDVVDLVAWHPRSPSRWARRTGLGGWLGAYGPQFMSPPPVMIWRAPLGWLRSGCAGLVLLGDAAERRRILLGLGSITAEDDLHRSRLRQLMERPLRIPPISIASERRSAA